MTARHRRDRRAVLARKAPALLDASCEPGSRVRPAPAEDDEIEARIAELERVCAEPRG